MKQYKLVWIIDGIVRETICSGTASLCNWKKQEIKDRYKTGLLQVRSENGIKYDLKKTLIVVD